jgi:hypothetical protein
MALSVVKSTGSITNLRMDSARGGKPFGLVDRGLDIGDQISVVG